MAETLTADICVIGGGLGAAAVAMAAAAFGVPSVLIETRKPEPASNVATLLAAARRAQSIRGAEAFGVSAPSIDLDFNRLRAHVERTAAALAPSEAAARLAGLGVRLIEGNPGFKDRRTLAVRDHCDIRARRFVIAVGAMPSMPDIPGLDQGVCFTRETIFSLTELPGHLIVLGATPTGVELAQAFRRLGSAVTVLETGEPLAGEDTEGANIVVGQLAREGVVIRSGVKVTRIGRARGGVQVRLEGIEGDDTVDGTHLLVAVGDKPNVAGLNLEAAGVAYTDDGIHVNDSLKTTNKRIYAIGAAIGQPGAATHHANLVIRNALFRANIKASRAAVARVIMTDPELAHTGLSEAETRERGLKLAIARWPYYDNVRAQAEGETRGHVKILAARNGRILGATIVGAQAGELIMPWTLAIAQKLNIRAMTDIGPASPTLMEIGKNAALDFFAPRLTSAKVRRIISWLRIFG